QLAQAKEEVPLRHRVVVGSETPDRVRGRPAHEESTIDVESGEEVVGRPIGPQKGRVTRAGSVNAILVRVDDGSALRAVESADGFRESRGGERLSGNEQQEEVAGRVCPTALVGR